MITAWAMGFEALVTWLSSFIYFELGLSAGSTALLLAFGFLLPTIIFALPSGLLAVKFGRLPVILSGFSLMAVVATQGIIVNSPQRLMATLVVAGLASSLVSVNLLPLAYDAGAYAQVGLITGLYYIATNSGGIIGPQVVGQLIAWQGNNYRMVFIFTPIILIGAIVWGIIFKRNYHPQKKSVTI
jgi:MFS family permease